VLNTRDASILSGSTTASQFIRELTAEDAPKYSVIHDEALDVVAVVVHPEGEVPVLRKLLVSKQGWVNGVVENVWGALRKNWRKLFW
jgi:N-acetyl-gamma-glutamyl-phosphate reductase/acetylglutamate kinase